MTSNIILLQQPSLFIKLYANSYPVARRWRRQNLCFFTPVSISIDLGILVALEEAKPLFFSSVGRGKTYVSSLEWRTSRSTTGRSEQDSFKDQQFRIEKDKLREEKDDGRGEKMEQIGDRLAD
ncbi:hypothetical protein QYF36_002297 [Acer negundo]|nr:hypothetical protein QYF36_002297 [Acer negundo]